MKKNPNIEALVRAMKGHFKKHGRSHLPWRTTHDPYRVLVSEVMLQQTQVDRVIPFYKNFVRRFPNARTLSRAPLSDVLKAWQGLGYNRRAKFLHQATKDIMAKHGGKFPRTAEEIEMLPGVGHYTARAVAAFAFNSPEVFIETNIRTVFTHHCFPTTEKVSDKELLPLVEEALQRSKMEPRVFYAALMDYGSYLKRSGVRLNHKSAHYIKQSKFEGSTRQLRAAILRELLKAPASLSALVTTLDRAKEDVEREVMRLHKDDLVIKQGQKFSVA